jgi:hypothetical protein
VKDAPEKCQMPAVVTLLSNKTDYNDSISFIYKNEKVVDFAILNRT